MSISSLKSIIESDEKVVFQIGDTVSFDGRHGFVQGVVANIRYKEKKGPRSLRGFGLDMGGPYQVVEIPSDRGMYTVPVRMLKLVKRGTIEDAQPAKQHVADVKNSIAQRDSDRRERTHQHLDANDLYNLEPGTKLMCKYSYGEKECTYVRTSPSGRIGVKNSIGSLDWHWPQFVRKAP